MKFLRLSATEWAIYLIAALLLFVTPIFISFHPLSGKPPQIMHAALNGKKAEKARLIYFWASWCGVCEKMQTPVSAVLDDYSGVTIAVKSGPDEKVKNYLAEQQLDWVTVNDENGDISGEYSVKAVPTVFFLNAAGEIAFTARGYVSETELRFRLWLASL